jgi:hypothetical protein
MAKLEHEHNNVKSMPAYEVGYRRAPVATRFKRGQSGNPKGRPTGNKTLKPLLDMILNEKVSLREGDRVRRVPKAEAVLRGIVINAMKGDQKSVVTLYKIAEQTGQFNEAATENHLTVSWASSPDEIEK